jgi:sugar O-acyltransferase (sialic acid O-acetyltransferase NeuD family)
LALSFDGHVSETVQCFSYSLHVVGGEGRLEILEIAQAAGGGRGGYETVLYYDENREGPDIVNEAARLPEGSHFVCSIGNVNARERLFDLFVKHGHRPVTLVSPLAFVSARSTLGEGVVVYPQACVSANARIGDNVLVNYQAAICHGTTVGPHSNICPGALIAGTCSIGRRAFVGIGAVLREGTTLCEDACIGAGSTVVRDIPSPGVYAGSPCRRIRAR